MHTIPTRLFRGLDKKRYNWIAWEPDGWAYATDGYRLHAVKLEAHGEPTRLFTRHPEIAPAPPDLTIPQYHDTIPETDPDCRIVVGRKALLEAIKVFEGNLRDAQPEFFKLVAARDALAEKAKEEYRREFHAKNPTWSSARVEGYVKAEMLSWWRKNDLNLRMHDQIDHYKLGTVVFQVIDGRLSIVSPFEKVRTVFLEAVKLPKIALPPVALNPKYLRDALALFPRRKEINFYLPKQSESPIRFSDEEALAVVMPVLISRRTS